MFKLKSIILLGVLSNLLIACGGSDPAKEEAGPAAGHDTGIRSTSPEAAYNVIKNRPYIISDLKQIPEPSALLMFTVYDKAAKTYNAHQCSSSLIAPDVILTNSHCIPDQIKYARNGQVRSNFSCKSWIVAHFPDNNNTKEETTGKTKFGSDYIDCETVIFTSANDQKPVDRGFQYNQDYAVIKLAKPVTNRKFLDVAYDGVNANQKLFTYSYDPIQGGGEFKRKECDAIEKSVLLAKSEYPIGRSILMANCHVIKGNSGSPVVDENGILRGALWGGPGNPADLQKQYEPRPDMAEFTYVTSAACMNVPGYIQAPPSGYCDRPVNALSTSGSFDVFKAKYEGSEVKTASNFPMAQFFKYEVTDERRLRHQAFLAHPVCISDLDGLKSYLEQPNTLAGEFSLTKFSVDKFHNRYLQFDYELNPNSFFDSVNYEVTPPFGANAEPKYKLLLRDKNSTDIIFTYYLSPCA